MKYTEKQYLMMLSTRGGDCKCIPGEKLCMEVLCDPGQEVSDGEEKRAA